MKMTRETQIKVGGLEHPVRHILKYLSTSAAIYLNRFSLSLTLSLTHTLSLSLSHVTLRAISPAVFADKTFRSIEAIESTFLADASSISTLFPQKQYPTNPFFSLSLSTCLSSIEPVNFCCHHTTLTKGAFLFFAFRVTFFSPLLVCSLASVQLKMGNNRTKREPL